MKMPNRIHRMRGILGTPHKLSNSIWKVAAWAIIAGVGLTSSGNLAFGQQREGDRPAEAGQRSSAEADAGSRRSAEADAGPRRSAEADAGSRRSAEADAGPRRSSEASQRNRERDARNERGRSESMRNFKPQTQREAALFQMITQLQREVESLRREVQATRGGRDQYRDVRREGDAARGQSEARGQSDRFVLSPRWRSTKDGKVFNAYDKNGDEVVTLDEWLVMFNGNISPSRREMQTKRFNDADPNRDGKFVPAEFIYWYSIGRHREVEQARRTNTRDESVERRGPRDGEGQTRGPRDGEGQTRGQRDGEGQNRGPRDGEGQTRGQRDGDRG